MYRLFNSISFLPKKLCVVNSGSNLTRLTRFFFSTTSAVGGKINVISGGVRNYPSSAHQMIIDKDSDGDVEHISLPTGISFYNDLGYDDSVVRCIVSEVEHKYGIDLREYLMEMELVLNIASEVKLSMLDHDNVEVNIPFSFEGPDNLRIVLCRSSIKPAVVQYNSVKFIEAASHYLRKRHPDTTQGAEKLWGSVASSIREFYAPLGVAISSHEALRSLFSFARKFHADKDDLADTFKDAEVGHRSFYRGGLDLYELKKLYDNVIIFQREFALIDSTAVYNELLPYLEKKKKTKDHKNLCRVYFKKMKFQEKVYDKIFSFDYVAKTFIPTVTKQSSHSNHIPKKLP